MRDDDDGNGKTTIAAAVRTYTIAFITTTSSVSISTYKEDCLSPQPPAAAIQQPNEHQREQPSFDQDDDKDDERNGTEEKDTHLKAPSHCHNSIAGARLPVGLFCMSPPHRNDNDNRPTDRPKRQLPLYPIHSTQSISISCSSPSLANNFLFYFGLLFLHLLSWLVAKREKSQRHLVVLFSVMLLRHQQ